MKRFCWSASLLVVVSSCATSGQQPAAVPAAAAPALSAPAVIPPVDGETAPQTAGGIGPFTGGIRSMVAGDGGIAVGTTESASVRVIDSTTGQTRAELASPTRDVIGLRFSPDGRHLCAISRLQNEVYLWDVAASATARTVRVATKVWGAVPLRGGAKMAVGGEQGLLVIVAVDTGQVVRSIPIRPLIKDQHAPDRLIVYGLALSNSGRWLSAVVGGRLLILVDLDGTDPVRTAEGDEKMQLSATEFSPDGRFLMARGTSFGRPQLIEVKRHPEGKETNAEANADASAVSSAAGCAPAMIAAGLIGYAICTAIVSASADANANANADANASASEPAPRHGGPGPDDKHGTVDVAGMAGELMLWRLGEAKPMLVKAFGRTFEQMAWSKDSTKVALLANAPQGGEFVKRVLIYQRSAISERSSTFPSPVASVTLGRSSTLFSGVVAGDQATLFMERSRVVPQPGPQPPAAARRYTIERWPLPALLPESEDENDEPGAGPPPTAATPTQ